VQVAATAGKERLLSDVCTFLEGTENNHTNNDSRCELRYQCSATVLGVIRNKRYSQMSLPSVQSGV